MYSYNITYLGSGTFQSTSSNIIQLNCQIHGHAGFCKVLIWKNVGTETSQLGRGVECRYAFPSPKWWGTPWGHRIAPGDARLFTEAISRPGCNAQGWQWFFFVLLVGRGSFSAATRKHVFPLPTGAKKNLRPKKMCKLSSQPKDSSHASFFVFGWKILMRWLANSGNLGRGPKLYESGVGLQEIYEIISNLIQQFMWRLTFKQDLFVSRSLGPKRRVPQKFIIKHWSSCQTIQQIYSLLKQDLQATVDCRHEKLSRLHPYLQIIPTSITYKLYQSHQDHYRLEYKKWFIISIPTRRFSSLTLVKFDFGSSRCQAETPETSETSEAPGSSAPGYAWNLNGPDGVF